MNQLTRKDVEDLIAIYQAGRLGDAETRARQLVALYPDVAALHSILGVALAGQQKLDAAVLSYQQALDLDPDDVDTLSNLGAALKGLDRFDEAVASYQAALKLAPDFANAHYNLGLVLHRLGRLGEAATSYRQAVQLDSNLAVAHYNLGNTLRDLVALDEAIESYQRGLQINPDHAEAHNNLGFVFKSSGRFEEATQSYRYALRINPDYAEAHNNLGNALRELGQLDEAAASFQRAIAAKPDYAEAHYNYHAHLLAEEDLASAIQELETAAAYQPANMNYKLHLGMLLEYRGDATHAKGALAEVTHGVGEDIARLDAWNYIKTAQPDLPQILGSIIEGFELGIAAAIESGLVLEFGVRNGATIRQIAAAVDQPVHGFDSFEGLPEAWHDEPAGSYSTKGAMPEVPNNVELHKGWFNETLPAFVRAHPEPVRFMNVDCDIYSSTKTVFDVLADQIIPGSVVVFDEYIGNERWRDDEYRAFQEAVRRYDWRYEYLAFSMFTKQVVVRMT